MTLFEYYFSIIKVFTKNINLMTIIKPLIRFVKYITGFDGSLFS